MKNEQKETVFTPPVLALAAMAFVLGISELVVVGILPAISEGLHTPLDVAGRLVAAFAVGYAVGTPLITAAAGRIPRRRLLFWLLLLFLAANAVSMLAPNVAVLYASRALTALVSGPLTASSMLFVREVTPAARHPRAIALLYTSFSLAAVIGVPLEAALCRAFGWRWTFALILGLTLSLLPVLLRVLPNSQATGAGVGLRRQFAVFHDARLRLCVGMLLCSAAATYTVYTYLTPILTGPLGLAETAVSPLLVVMGLCSTASNAFSGKLGARGGLTRLPPIFLLQTLTFGLLPFLLRHTAAGLAGLLMMGLLMYVMNTPAQMLALDLAEREYPYAAHLCASVQMVSFNLGIAVGSCVGSAVQAAWGLEFLGLPAAVFALSALALNARLLRCACRPGLALN